MVKASLISCLSAGLSTHQVVTVRLPTDRLIDDVHANLCQRKQTNAARPRDVGRATGS